jgi:hypothetical protein
MKKPVVCLVLAALCGVPVSAQTSSTQGGRGTPIEVYKTPTCGCCAKWVDHLKAEGFVPTVHEQPDLSSVKSKAGVPPQLRSCHTAMVGGYVVEGHVPADVIRKLLTEKPKVTGVAVAGMPVGSPGMEQGDRKDPYDVIAFTAGGNTSVYAKRN